MRYMLIAAASTLALLIAAPAVAADLIVDEQTVPFDAPIVYDWTGPYVGLNLGVAFGLPNFVLDDEDDFDTLDDGEFFPYVGVQAGFNFQLDNNFVVGIEGDIQASNFGHDNVDEFEEEPDDFTPDLDWFGTLRLRAGVAMDRTLVYATGGLAFGQSNLDDAWWLPDDFSTEDTRFGFAIGAGIEQALTDNVSIKAEYLFVDLGAMGDTTPFEGGDFNGDLAFHTVRAGLNFKF